MSGVMGDSYPLLFRFDDLVSGNDFVGRVQGNGRALLVNEDDGFWVYGVVPAGCAAGGETVDEALAAFKQTYRSVLLDCAAATCEPVDFEKEVRAFFTGHAEFEDEWKAAREAVRANGAELPSIRRTTTEFDPWVDVLAMKPTPQVNAERQDFMAIYARAA